MKSESEKLNKTAADCRIDVSCELGEAVGYQNLFDFCWEVFVIKKDKPTGKLVGKLACCALAPV